MAVKSSQFYFQIRVVHLPTLNWSKAKMPSLVRLFEGIGVGTLLLLSEAGPTISIGCSQAYLSKNKVNYLPTFLLFQVSH